MTKKWTRPPIIQAVKQLQLTVRELHKRELQQKLSRALKLVKQYNKKNG